MAYFLPGGEAAVGPQNEKLFCLKNGDCSRDQKWLFPPGLCDRLETTLYPIKRREMFCTYSKEIENETVLFAPHLIAA
jgi:hypothetical protein